MHDHVVESPYILIERRFPALSINRDREPVASFTIGFEAIAISLRCDGNGRFHSVCIAPSFNLFVLGHTQMGSPT